jgi:hypothetical protein
MKLLRGVLLSRSFWPPLPVLPRGPVRRLRVPVLWRRLAPLALHDLSGTIWQGRADAVELFRQNLGALEWRLQPAPLLHGQAIAQLNADRRRITATGQVDRGADGQMSFRDVVVHMPARIGRARSWRFRTRTARHDREST